MKHLIVGAMAALFLAGSSSAADPKIGDSKDQVLDALGNPKGRMLMKNIEAFFYDRGSVELTGGQVSAVKLISEEQLAQKKANQIEQDRRNAAEREKLMAEGAVEKERMLADAAFARKPPAEQVDAWRKFAARYPGVSVEAEVQALNAELAAEAQKKAALAAPRAEEPLPKLSSSKLRKLRRSMEPKEP